MKQAAIIGGGITGLAAAYHLERTTTAEIHLYEEQSEAGGKIATHREGEYLVEQGPDCFFTRKPGVLELVEELGLPDQLITPSTNHFGLFFGGRIHPVPKGLISFAHIDPTALMAVEFLSSSDKERILAEADQPPVTSDQDESIRSFFTRRFGSAFSLLVAEPLLAGTYGGDPDRLSMDALFPNYRAMEREYGSLSAVPSPKSDSAKGASFMSFRGGMSTLVHGLRSALKRTTTHSGQRVEKIPEVDAVIVATPSDRAAALLPGIGLEALPRRSARIATFGFEAKSLPGGLDGSGFLAPATEGLPVTGATWTTNKWSGRAPNGEHLIRLFLREGACEDEALEMVGHLIGVIGRPIYRRTDSWINSLPQYELGHLGRIEAIEKMAPPNVVLAGASYRGIGIPDCLRQGRAAAEKLSNIL